MRLNDYKKNGYFISDQLIHENQINLLRDSLNKEFSFNKKDKYRRRLIDFRDLDLVKKILSFYTHYSIRNIIDELKKKYNSKVTILPIFEVHKNYHVNLKESHGWHRDCGGELKYEYCNNILFSKNYFFAKIGIYLQKNEKYGGSIDIIKNSHKNFSYYRIILRKIKNIPLRILTFIHKNFNKIYNFLPEKLFMFFLNAKKLNPKLGSAVFFDSRIIHRGSPIEKNQLKEVKYSTGKYLAELPKNKDKYSIYCQIGTTESIDSYMYDRLKREGNQKELQLWVKEIEFISKFNRELSDEISAVISPIKEKYIKYLS